MKRIFLITSIIVLMSSVSFAQGGPRWEEREWQRGAQQREYEREEKMKEQERQLRKLEEEQEKRLRRLEKEIEDQKFNEEMRRLRETTGI